MEFYVTADRGYVDDFAIYVNVTGCGSYKITHLTQEPISGNQLLVHWTVLCFRNVQFTNRGQRHDGAEQFPHLRMRLMSQAARGHGRQIG